MTTGSLRPLPPSRLEYWWLECWSLWYWQLQGIHFHCQHRCLTMTFLSVREQNGTMMLSDAKDRDQILGPVLHASEDRLLALRNLIG